ncbi:hypothetical protein ACFY1P_20575 [Streptomyces sp. NPDC001407]|uniref:hypothetical protein n=1 Tax=Streptomyces sp. NPDC001407 TaxID=3364573 RepID=UPI0036B5CA78
MHAEDNRQHIDLILTVHPAGTPDDQVPPGDILDKEHCRLVIRWPGRDAQREGAVAQRETDAVPEGV